MNIIIKTTNIKMSPSIEAYIEEKIGGLNKFLKNFNPDLVEARIEVGLIKRGQRSGDIFRAEVNLNLGGDILRAENTAESLHAAIDLVKDELSREIKKKRDKDVTTERRGARSWKKFWQINPFSRFRQSKSEGAIKK